MAKFEVSEKITGRFEGGYANNPNDRGGETFAGIARKFWPNWEGWKKIDQYKKEHRASGSKTSIANWVNNSSKIITEPTLGMVSKFYKTNFWDTNKLDAILDQQIANTVYDFGVNSGTDKSAKTLQQAANDTRLTNLVIDGKIGSKTIEGINALNPQKVYENFNRRREDFYKSIASGNQEKFLKSWLNRLKPYIKCDI